MTPLFVKVMEPYDHEYFIVLHKNNLLRRCDLKPCAVLAESFSHSTIICCLTFLIGTINDHKIPSYVKTEHLYYVKHKNVVFYRKGDVI